MIKTKNHCGGRTQSIMAYDTTKLKAELLCLGLKVPRDLLNLMDNYFLEKNFVHGSQITLGNSTVINVSINEQFVLKHSPFELSKDNEGWFILKECLPVTRCKPLLMPQWADIPLNGSVKIGDIVRPHSDNILFCTPLKKCVFETLNQKCKFCTFFDYYGIANHNNLELVRRAFEAIFSQYENNYREIAIGGATSNLEDFGVGYYSNVVKIIKRIRPNIKISLEIIPPFDLNLLYELSSAGVDAIIMNMEVFDQNMRQKICPGKSVVSNTHFFKAWEKALNILGENRVGSVLIVGLEDQQSTIIGCKRMVEIGVIPTLIPFRPYDLCELNYLPPILPEYYLSIYRQLLSEVNIKDIDPLRQPGCTRCGGCSLETLIMREE